MMSIADSDLFVVYMFVICIAFTQQSANGACNLDQARCILLLPFTAPHGEMAMPQGIKSYVC